MDSASENPIHDLYRGIEHLNTPDGEEEHGRVRPQLDAERHFFSLVWETKEAIRADIGGLATAESP